MEATSHETFDETDAPRGGRHGDAGPGGRPDPRGGLPGRGRRHRRHRRPRAQPNGRAGDSPTGWWYGTDSLPVAISGNPPYQVPRTGGAYGGYIGMTGS